MKALIRLILYICAVPLIAQNTYEYRIAIDNIFETYDEGEDIVNHTENDDGDFLAVQLYFTDSETQQVSLMKYAADGHVIWRQVLDNDPGMIFTYISPPEICSYDDRYAMIHNQGIQTNPPPGEVIETYHTLSIIDENGDIIQEHTLLMVAQQQFADVIPNNGGFVVATTNVQYPFSPPVVVSNFINRLIVYATDIDGTPLWEKQLLFEDETNTQRLILYETISDSDDNIYLFCSYESTHDGLILIKLNEDGEILFVNKYEDPTLETWGYDPQCRAAINSQGDLYCYLTWQNNPGIAQYTNLYKFDQDGEVLFTKRVEELVFVTSLSADSDNGFAILFPNLNDQFGLGFEDSKDPALAKFDADGNFDWGYIYGEEGDNFTDRHIICDDRGYMIWAHTMEDFYMIKTDIHGTSGCEIHPLELSTVDFEVEITTPDWIEVDMPETIEDESIYVELESPELIEKCCLGNFPSAAFDYDFTETDFQVSFTNTSLNADTYAWDFGDGTNAGYENPVHDFPGAGDYTICLTVFNECTHNQYCIDITVPTESTVGIGENSLYTNIYPNPISNTIEIESKKSMASVHIRNHQAQIIRSFSANGLYQKYLAGDLPKGMYLMEIHYENDQKSYHKILLQ